MIEVALELVGDLDWLNDRADVLKVYGEALVACGEEVAAWEVLDEVLVHYECKGNRVAASALWDELVRLVMMA